MITVIAWVLIITSSNNQISYSPVVADIASCNDMKAATPFDSKGRCVRINVLK